MKAIYADLNKFASGAIPLTTIGTRRDLEMYEITLEENLALVFYMDDVDENGNADNLIFPGIVQFDAANQVWVAKVDPDQIKNESKLTYDEKVKLEY